MTITTWGTVFVTNAPIDNARFWNGGRGLGSIDFPKLLAAPAQLSGTERLLLFSLVRNISPTVAVEVGTFQGGSAYIIAAALRSAGHGHLWCVEPWPQLQIDWNDVADHATLLQESSPQAFHSLAGLIPAPIEFAFIDGEHTYDAVLRDTHGVMPLLADEAWILYHDAASESVRAGIDRLLRDESHLQDAGMLGRFFNAEAWPGELFGGLRLLHFQRSTERPWMPASASVPREDSLPEKLAPAQQKQFRAAIDKLIAEKKTPIGLYGVTSRLAGLIPTLANYPSCSFLILEEDLLLEGQHILGWPVVPPQRALERGVRGIIPCHSVSNGFREKLRTLADQGIAIETPPLTQAPIASRPLPSRQFLSAEHAFFEAARRSFLNYGCRRFAVLGTSPLVQRALGRLLVAKPYPKVVAIIEPGNSGSGTVWNLPVLGWDELVEHRIDCVLVPSNSAHRAARAELARRGIEQIRVSGPRRRHLWFGVK